jgi:uncharacterized phiE125 gp8 family phage protein
MSIITLEEAKNFLRVDTADDDSLISALLATATEIIEKYTGQILQKREFVYTLDEAADEVWIPYQPLQEITKIEVVDDDGNNNPVSSDIFLVDAAQGRVKLKDGYSWPEHRGFASFVITGQAGYEEGTLPGGLKTAILLALAILYENRGIIDAQKVIDSISAVCWPYKVARV